MFVWTSGVHATHLATQLPVMTVASGSNSPFTINFASIASGTAGCLTGFSCYRISTWPTGNPTATNASGGSLTFGTGVNQIKITTSGGFTSGPIASVSDTVSTAAMGFNGGIFQGFSTTTGQLTITLTHTFHALTTTNPTFGLVESGAFLQLGTGGDVRTDSLTMLGAVDGANIAQISKTVTGASALTSSSYSLNLSPTVGVPNPSAGVALKYTWTYKYNNGVNNTSTSGTATSKFSDPPEHAFDGGIGNCETPSENPGCTTAGGGAAFLGDPNDPNGIIASLTNDICPDGCVSVASTAIPEPSSLLLLGLSLLSGGIFFASRLRKEKERETR
jgi:hypothetical protein